MQERHAGLQAASSMKVSGQPLEPLSKWRALPKTCDQLQCPSQATLERVLETHRFGHRYARYIATRDDRLSSAHVRGANRDSAAERHSVRSRRHDLVGLRPAGPGLAQ